jgi:hypothetical protein
MNLFHGEDLLFSYSKQWNSFRFSSKVTHGMCMYLNRHWVKRENDEGRHRDIYPVYGVRFSQSLLGEYLVPRLI